LTEVFDQLLVWINTHPQHAGWVIFLVALAESLAIVGILVPGVVILLGAGTLIGNGTLDFWPMMVWAVAGAIIGDAISFQLGRHFESASKHLSCFEKHPEHLKKGHAFFGKWGELSVIIGRFFGPIRAIIPLIAGLMGMKPVRFYAANIFSALLWAPAYLAPGIVLGSLIDQDDLGTWLSAALGLFIGIAVIALIKSKR
jgi:membrane protein DedA with SNARE-associated domain